MQLPGMDGAKMLKPIVKNEMSTSNLNWCSQDFSHQQYHKESTMFFF